MLRSKLTLQTVLAILITTLATAAIVRATTIGNNISTDGTLIVTGQTTLNGNVGISTTSPSQKLSITGKLYTTGGIQFPDGSLQTAAASAASLSSAGQVAFYNTDGSTVSGTSTITILPSGYVGIGTSSPSSLLTLGGLDINAATLSIGTAPVNYNGVIGVNGIDIHANQTNPLSLGGAHAVRDESTYFVSSGTGGYASFDSNARMTGSIAYNHLASFQARNDYEGAGLLDTMNSFIALPTINGSVSVLNGVSISDPLGNGAITQQNGIYIAPLARGSTNYAIYQNGNSTPSRFEGKVNFTNRIGLNTISPLYQLQISSSSPSIALEGSNSSINSEYGSLLFINRNVDSNTTFAKVAVKTGTTNYTSQLTFSTYGVNSTAYSSLKQKMVIDEVGNLGLGTSTPSAKLDINNYLGLTNDLLNISTTTAANIFSSLLNVKANGNVGIGTTTPAATLDIEGYMRLKKNTAQPVACSTTNSGSLALNSLYYLCICNGSSWVYATSTQACAW